MGENSRNAQAYLATQETPTPAGAWLSVAHANQRRAECAQGPTDQGTRAAHRVVGDGSARPGCNREVSSGGPVGPGINESTAIIGSWVLANGDAETVSS